MATSPGPKTRSRSRLPIPFDAGDSSADESPPMDVSQMRAQYEKTPGRLPIALTPGIHGMTPARKRQTVMTPGVTPAMNGKLTAIDPLRDRLEEDEAEGIGGKRISPGLMQLRQTPGRALQKQKLLEKKFHASKSKLNGVNVGGGISVWPEMEDMRLTRTEVWGLGMVCVVLVAAVYTCFQLIHGALMQRLDHYNNQLRIFASTHQLDSTSQDSFNTSVLQWHMQFTNVIDSIHNDFDMDWYRVPVRYQLVVALYFIGIGVLFYYLIDNMFAKNKLTPWRIKNWVSLLVVIGCWSVLMVGLLAKAQKLEYLVESNIHILSKKMGDLVFESGLDLTIYNNVLLLWRTCCLPPTTLGTLSIMGIFQVQDVSYYLQYYSLPVLTALLTPVVRLVMALNQVYGTP